MLAAAALLRSGCSRSSRRALAVAKPAARSMSWVKDVTVNVTFINHEVSASVTTPQALILVPWMYRLSLCSSSSRWSLRGATGGSIFHALMCLDAGPEDNRPWQDRSVSPGCCPDA
jgi:hypothetical protein